MARDRTRADLIQDALREAGLDVLVCCLPANVLLLSGYWPVVGKSLALAVRDRGTLLLVPEDERELAEAGGADEVRVFRPASLDDLRTVEEGVREPLAEIARQLGLHGGALGYEDGGTSEPASYSAMHVYGPRLLDLLADAFPSCEQVPASVRLSRLRAVKTPREIDRIRTACRIAGGAFEEGARGLRPGLSEREIAVRFHAPLCTGGTDGDAVTRLGGFMFCMAGPDAARACGAFARSGPRRVAPGEFALVHCNSYADGYWTDITRTYFLGKIGGRPRALYEAVLAARAAALDVIRPGVTGSAVDRAARDVLRGRGLGEAFKHSTGHGVGFGAIDPDALPRLHPRSDDRLEVGMVFNVEPAVYFEGQYGLRHCDMVTVTEGGVEVLTPFQGSAEELTLPAAGA